MYLYLIRHGEVEGAGDGRLLGRSDVPLSEQGLQQSSQLAEFLSKVSLSAIYSSDLKRAQVMAEIIGKRLCLNARVNDAWREIDMGDWEGLTLSAIHEATPQLVENLLDDPFSFTYPGGESFASFNSRIQSALMELLAIHQDEQVALVTHGGVCRLIIGNVLGIPSRNWLRLAQDYACLNIIEWYGANPILRTINHTSLL